MWARAAVLGLVVLTSGAVSHVAADGLLPPPPVLALLLVVATAAAALFLRSRATSVRLVTLVVGGQALTHVVLSATAGHTGTHTGAHAAASTDGPTGGLAATSGHLVEHAVAQGPLMVLVHALGAVALGLWLAVGESALWHLIVLAGVRVRIALVVASALAGARVSVLGSLDASRRLPVPVPLRLPLPDTLPHRLVVRRGPPALLAA